jgi:hypothetical protein
MKRLLIFAFIIPLSLVAQQNAPEYHIGISVKPEVSVMTIQDQDESSEAQYGFTGGLTFGYNLNAHVTFESGLYYGTKNISHTQGGLVFGSDIDPTSGVTGNSTAFSKIQITDIEIPIQMKYLFYKRFYLRTGMGLNFLSEQSVDRTIEHSDGTITTLDSEPRSYVDYSATIGVGYLQPIGEKFNFNIEPYIKYYFRDNIIPITHLYNIGINASFTMKLGK